MTGALTFPTRPTPGRRGYLPPPGVPDRATGCQCVTDRLELDAGQCFRCGQHLPATIAQTFADRARQITRRRST